MKRLIHSCIDNWNRFWFAPTPTSTLAVLRICYGLVCLAFAASLYRDLGAFFFQDGVLPTPPEIPWGKGLLSVFPGDAAVTGMYVLLVVASVALIVGFHSRLAAIAVFVALLSFHRRNLFVFNAGDGLLRIQGLFLALAPSGAGLSLDSLRRDPKNMWQFPSRSPWAIRLLQVQISVVYAATVWAKLRGVRWNDGTAVSYALRLSDLARFSIPESLASSLIFSNVATYGTLLIETSLAFLIWNRKARPFVLRLGVFFHLTIDLTLLTGFFSWAMFVGYIAFIPEDSMSRWLQALRLRMAKWGPPRFNRTAEAQVR